MNDLTSSDGPTSLIHVYLRGNTIHGRKFRKEREFLLQLKLLRRLTILYAIIFSIFFHMLHTYVAAPE